MPKNIEMSLLLEFPVSGDDFAGHVLLIREKESDKRVLIFPGDSLNINLSANPSGKDKPPIEIDLKIDFGQPFTSDAIVLTSLRADVRYGAKEKGEKANV